MRRAVILFPSGLTLGNLFFGIFAIITASRGDFRRAGIYVIIGGIFDALDGRVARAANAGTQFGEELDSLVDAVSFGLAPAMIMYFAILDRDGWDWIFVFFFAAMAVMRLARFNIEQAGTSKSYFQGLPSPAAGITLASYYWFSQSWLYTYGAIGNLPWQELMRFLMAVLAFLMISNVPYPVLPRVGFRSLKAIGASVLVFGSIGLLLTKRLEFFFPLCIGYVAFGLVRNLVGRLFERRQPTLPYDLSEGEDDEDDEDLFESDGSQVHASRQGYLDPREVRRRQRHHAEPTERTEKAPRSEDRPARPARPERPERPERGERPQRTEAERAARREKREKRDKRQRSKEERINAAPEVAPGASGMTFGETLTDSAPDTEIVGSSPGGAEPTTPAGGEGEAPTRKRKRRRRRGERKERGGPPSASDEGGDDASGGASDAESFEPTETHREQPYQPDVAPPHPPSNEPSE